MTDRCQTCAASGRGDDVLTGLGLAFVLAFVLADRAVVTDIACEGQVEKLPGSPYIWYDTRPMLSEHEQPSDFAEMARQALCYALVRGLIQHHHVHGHLVRILRMPD